MESLIEKTSLLKPGKGENKFSSAVLLQPVHLPDDTSLQFL